MEKKISKQAKRRLTILTPLLILALGYLCFTIVSTGISLYKLHTEEKELKEELKNLKGKSSDLKNEINKLQDKDYVARYARENYSYTKDGEYVIKVDEEKSKKENKTFTKTDEYIIYGGIVLGVLIVFYIIAKSKKRKKKSSD